MQATTQAYDAALAALDAATGRDPLAPCGYCRRCAVHDDPGGCLEVERFAAALLAVGANNRLDAHRFALTDWTKVSADTREWLTRKRDGLTAAQMLAPLPEGAEFTLGWEGGVAYKATYRKNAEGSWDQVANVAETPYVIRMDAAHLGFVVGAAKIAAALEQRS